MHRPAPRISVQEARTVTSFSIQPGVRYSSNYRTDGAGNLRLINAATSPLAAALQIPRKREGLLPFSCVSFERRRVRKVLDEYGRPEEQGRAQRSKASRRFAFRIRAKTASRWTYPLTTGSRQWSNYRSQSRHSTWCVSSLLLDLARENEVDALITISNLVGRLCCSSPRDPKRRKTSTTPHWSGGRAYGPSSRCHDEIWIAITLTMLNEGSLPRAPPGGQAVDQMPVLG